MTSALVSSSNGPDAPALIEDLHAVGIEVLETADCTNLLQSVIKHAPELVVIYENHPDIAFFDGIAAVNATAPRPVAVFTSDPDASNIALATRSGIHAYVVNGYSRKRLRSVLHLAQARFSRDERIRAELAEVNRRFAERKLVDRAKGILMGARQLREEEAYRTLRSAAMHRMQRIGQVSQQVIDGARYAEAINRSGQLRMLSQRLVKLYALACMGRRPDETKRLFVESISQVDGNLAALTRSLSQPTFGDLLDAVLAPWKPLRIALDAPAVASRVPEVDRLAERMLRQAERLTANLEIVGFAAALHVINVSGRQRMLSQRLAKAALMRTLLHGKAAEAAATAMQTTQAELVEGFAYLAALPLSNAEISGALGRATEAWDRFRAALEQLDTKAGQEAIAILSEVLLTQFDRLTDDLERGMQTLVR